MKEREFTFSATFFLPSPSSDLKVPIDPKSCNTLYHCYRACALARSLAKRMSATACTGFYQRSSTKFIVLWRVRCIISSLSGDFGKQGTEEGNDVTNLVLEAIKCGD